MLLTHLDLFSGIGGFALGLRMAGRFETIGFCEIDPFCQQVIRKHWPEVPIYGDIRELPTDEFMGVDIITGGFPCQPASVAGKQRGTSDDRWLWPELLRVVQIIKPTWCLFENVYGLVTLKQGMVFEQVLSEMEASGYDTQTFIIPAVAVDALHKRDRVWIVGHAQGTGRETCQADSMGDRKSRSVYASCTSDVANSPSKGWGFERGTSKAVLEYGEKQRPTGCSSIPRRAEWEPQPCVGRVASRVPNRLDRLRGLGNSVVPQIVAEFGRMIMHAKNSDIPRATAKDFEKLAKILEEAEKIGAEDEERRHRLGIEQDVSYDSPHK